MSSRKKSLFDQEGWGLNAGGYLMRGGPLEWFQAHEIKDTDERGRVKWKRMILLTGVEPAIFEQVFGPRTQTWLDGESRRLHMWRIVHRVGDRDVLFWISAHKGRGSDIEFQRDITAQEALACYQWVQQKIEDAGLVPPVAEMDFSDELRANKEGVDVIE